MNSKLPALVLAVLVGAGADIVAQGPIAIPASWELRLVATNGADCAFSYVDMGGNLAEVFLQVGQRRLGPFARIDNLGWSPDGSRIAFSFQGTKEGSGLYDLSWAEGKEIPGAILKDSVAVYDKGSLTVGTARR